MPRWNGVVGHTLYGDVDIGMSNIDITWSRYSQAVDYSAFIRSLYCPLHFSCNLFSPNEARILSRKAGPSSRLFLLLKPFSPLLWSLMAAVFLLFFFLFLAFKRMNEKYFGLRTERRDSVWVFTGLFHVMLRPACLISPAWPRSSHYLYLAFQLFFYFMLHFFYLVSPPIISLLFKLISRAFSTLSWFECRMNLLLTLLLTSS